jgi:polar amino acid transport system substrate-binding protein
MQMLFSRAALALGLILAPLAAHAEGALARIAANGKVTAAAVPDQLPLSGYDAQGALSGFDIDVSREIAKRLGAPVTFVNPAWPVILSGKWGGGFDFCACSITPTKQRATHLAFPATYRFDGAIVVVRADNTHVNTLADATGKRIGVKARTTFEAYLNHDLKIYHGVPVTYRIDKPQVVTYPDKEAALAAVVKGDVDASVLSYVAARGAIDAGAPLRIVPGFLFFEPVAVAVAPGDKPFERRIADIIADMHKDGSLSQLSTHWFGIDLTRILQ